MGTVQRGLHIVLVRFCVVIMLLLCLSLSLSPSLSRSLLSILAFVLSGGQAGRPSLTSFRLWRDAEQCWACCIQTRARLKKLARGQLVSFLRFHHWRWVGGWPVSLSKSRLELSQGTCPCFCSLGLRSLVEQVHEGRPVHERCLRKSDCSHLLSLTSYLVEVNLLLLGA